MKLFERGVPNETLFRIIDANTRLPTSVAGDIQSQLAAVHHAGKSYARLIAKYGVEQFRACLAELQTYAEKMMRARSLRFRTASSNSAIIAMDLERIPNQLPSGSN